MSAWGILRNLKFGEILTLSKIFLKNPRYFVPTFKATVETVNVCDFKFGDQHHFDNPTNAFRHAYWTYLICVNCYKVTGTRDDVALWAKKITDLHEAFAPNGELAMEMDLHNNQIGKEIFIKHCEGIPDPVKFFKKMMSQAKQVKSVEDIKNTANQLVYIEK